MLSGMHTNKEPLAEIKKGETLENGKREYLVKGGKAIGIIRTFFIDDIGLNKIILNCTHRRKTMYLQLQNDNGRKRKIGTVTNSTRTIFIKRNRIEHLFRKGNAYGLNYYVLANSKSFDFINLSDEHEDWKIPLSFLIDKNNGFFLQFMQQGFEKQKFFSLTELEQFKVHPKENRRL